MAPFQKFRGPYYSKRATEFFYGDLFARRDRAIMAIVKAKIDLARWHV